jgi:hypothetical protein
MIGRMTDWFKANPNAYLAIMAAYCALATTGAAVFPNEWPGLLLGGVSLLICVAVIFAPFEGGAEAKQMAHWERRYSFAHVVAYPAVATVIAATSFAIASSDVSPWIGVGIAGGFSAMNIGRHIRYRWVERQTATPGARGMDRT